MEYLVFFLIGLGSRELVDMTLHFMVITIAAVRGDIVRGKEAELEQMKMIRDMMSSDNEEKQINTD